MRVVRLECAKCHTPSGEMRIKKRCIPTRNARRLCRRFGLEEEIAGEILWCPQCKEYRRWWHLKRVHAG